MYQKMQDHWTTHGPPVYLSVAGYLGLIKKKKPKGKGQGQPSQKMTGSWDDLERMFSQTGGVIQ